MKLYKNEQFDPGGNKLMVLNKHAQAQEVSHSDENIPI